MLQTERSLHYAFQMLARCPKTSDQSCKMVIPETLFYQHGSLRIWYYTDDNGDVIKRDKRDCNKTKILEYFCGNIPIESSQPVAVYLHYSNTNTTPDVSTGDKAGDFQISGNSVVGPTGGAAVQTCQQYGEDAEPISIEYFDREALQNFLGTRDNKHDVIVQKFVQGKTQNFATMQVIWSPFKTITMQRQNVNNIRDERIPLYNRCNTFENTSYLSREVRTTPKMVTRMGSECQRMVDHFYAIDQRQVLRMVAFFAFDDNKRATFLWASEIQMSVQPISLQEAKRQMAFQTKRRLLLISPPTVFGDVITPNYLLNQSVKKKVQKKGEITSNSTRISSVLGQTQSVQKQLSLLDSTFITAYESKPYEVDEQKRIAAMRPQIAIRLGDDVGNGDLQSMLSSSGGGNGSKKMTHTNTSMQDRYGNTLAQGSLRAASCDPIRSRRTGGKTPLLGSKTCFASSNDPDKEIVFCRGGGGGFFLRDKSLSRTHQSMGRASSAMGRSRKGNNLEDSVASGMDATLSSLTASKRKQSSRDLKASSHGGVPGHSPSILMNTSAGGGSPTAPTGKEIDWNELLSHCLHCEEVGADVLRQEECPAIYEAKFVEPTSENPEDERIVEVKSHGNVDLVTVNLWKIIDAQLAQSFRNITAVHERAIMVVSDLQNLLEAEFYQHTSATNQHAMCTLSIPLSPADPRGGVPLHFALYIVEALQRDTHVTIETQLDELQEEDDLSQIPNISFVVEVEKIVMLRKLNNTLRGCERTFGASKMQQQIRILENVSSVLGVLVAKVSMAQPQPSISRGNVIDEDVHISDPGLLVQNAQLISKHAQRAAENLSKDARSSVEWPPRRTFPLQ